MLLGVIVLLLIAGGVFIPYGSAWLSLGHTITTERNRYAKDLWRIEKSKDYAQLYAAYASELNRNPGETDEAANAQFVKEIEHYVHVSGLAIVDVNVLPAQHMPGEIHLEIEAQIEIPATKLAEFFSTLAEGKDLIAIRTFTLERKDAMSEIVLLRATFTKTKI